MFVFKEIILTLWWKSNWGGSKGEWKETYWETPEVKQERNDGDLDQGSGIRDVLRRGQ